MRPFPHMLVFAALAACAQAPTATLPVDLDEAFEAAGPGARLPVLVLHDRGAPDLAGTRVLRDHRHVPVTLVELDRRQALELAARGARLAPDLPLVAARNPGQGGGPPTKATGEGVSLTSDPDLVRVSSGSDQAHALGADGSGVVVALLDSGVRSNHPDLHPDLVVDHADFVSGDHVQALRDPFGHGTMVAGVLAGSRDGVAGVAPGARLVSARVLDADGLGTVSSAVAAVDWVLERREATGASVLHFSVGAAPRSSFTEDPLALAVDAALREGMVVVAAAGNFGSSDGEGVYGGIVSPANHPGVITVGAVDPQGSVVRSGHRVADFSSRGPTLFDGLGKPDLVAPGHQLPLTGRAGGTLWTTWTAAHLAEHEGVDLDDTPYMVSSGTSFAAPAVTGAVALILQQDPTFSAVQVKAILQLTAGEVAEAGPLSVGAGQVNALGATRLARYWADWRAGLEPALPSTRDLISGEEVPWGLTLYWDGFGLSDCDTANARADGLRASGWLDGTGILWDGHEADFRELCYVGLVLQGEALLDPRQPLYADGMWGTGILWDGDLSLSPGRVWSLGEPWVEALVWPDNLLAAGMASPLFDAPAMSDLTSPVEGAADPMPPEPDFESD